MNRTQSAHRSCHQPFSLVCGEFLSKEIFGHAVIEENKIKKDYLPLSLALHQKTPQSKTHFVFKSDRISGQALKDILINK